MTDTSTSNGEWCNNTTASLTTYIQDNPNSGEKVNLLPMVMFLDYTHVDEKSRQKIKPVQYSLEVVGGTNRRTPKEA